MIDHSPPPETSTAPPPVSVSAIEVPRSTSDVLLETALVLLICIIPPIFYSSAAVVLGRATTASFTFQALFVSIQSLGSIGLVLYLIYRSGESYARFGMVQFHAKRELWHTFGLLVGGLLAHYLIWYLLSAVLDPDTFAGLAQTDHSALASPSGTGALALLVLMSLANGFAEELVVRAYLIPRLERLFGTTMIAFLISTLIFASYHAYQGSGGVISTLILGLIYGGYFCVYRRLWPLAISHAILDVLGFLLMHR